MFRRPLSAFLMLLAAMMVGGHGLSCAASAMPMMAPVASAHEGMAAEHCAEAPLQGRSVKACCQDRLAVTAQVPAVQSVLVMAAVKAFMPPPLMLPSQALVSVRPSTGPPESRAVSPLPAPTPVRLKTRLLN